MLIGSNLCIAHPILWQRVLDSQWAGAGSFKVAGLNQVGFMDVFESTFVFLHGRGERFHADRSSSEFVDDGEENLAIHFIEPSRIDAEPGERLCRPAGG